MSVLTPWFPPSVKPVRVGLYLTRMRGYDPVPFLLKWDRRRWRNANGDGFWSSRQWCGLAFDPSALPDGRTQREIQSWAALEAKRGEA